MTITMKPFTARTVVRVLLITGALLLIPFVAMLFTAEMAWGAGDFAAAALLLAATGLALELARAKARTRTVRLLTGGGIVLTLLLVWAELAVGIVS